MKRPPGTASPAWSAGTKLRSSRTSRHAYRPTTRRSMPGRLWSLPQCASLVTQNWRATLLKPIDHLWAEIEPRLLSLYEHYRGQIQSLQVTNKPDHSLLSEADTAVQRYLTSVISTYDPSARFLAEEDDTSL